MNHSGKFNIFDLDFYIFEASKIYTYFKKLTGC